MKNSAGFIKTGAQTIAIPRHTLRLIHSCSRRHTNPLPSKGHPLDLSLQQLLRDADLSLLKSRNAHSKLSLAYPFPDELHPTEPSNSSISHERETFPTDDSYTIEDDIDAWHTRQEKRSPEAILGSKHLGLSDIPSELEKAITGILNNSDKDLLRSDAKRLFLKQSNRRTGFGNQWTAEMPSKFKESKKRKSARLTPREALAYAIISIPAQYASIRNVLRETRLRLGHAWATNIRGVVDFGSGTGVAMWASFAEFAHESAQGDADIDDTIQQPNPLGVAGSGTNSISNTTSTTLSRSSLRHYLLLENRRALSAISKNLTKGLSFGSTKVRLEDFWGKDGKEVSVPPENTIAIMAFTLTDLPTDLARKQMLRELWNTKADTMIIIDHASDVGFSQVAAAREYLLAKGRRPVSSENTPNQGVGSSPEIFTRGSHVVAPCPHDGPCPMNVSPAAVPSAPARICSFSQRLERPLFLRKTKHASQGYESIEYSYVVIRRGTRPRPPADTALWDMVPPSPPKRRRLKRSGILKEAGTVDEPLSQTKDQSNEIALEFHENPESPANVRSQSRHWISDAPARAPDDIRAESYHWPRILRPPLKRSGHVLLETCTKEGNIARHIIPRSQGKQHYYDARKAKWGDSFPWESKNGPDTRKRGPVDTVASLGEKYAGAGNVGSEPNDDTPLEEIEGEWELSFHKDGRPRITRLE